MQVETCLKKEANCKKMARGIRWKFQNQKDNQVRASLLIYLIQLMRVRLSPDFGEWTFSAETRAVS